MEPNNTDDDAPLSGDPRDSVFRQATNAAAEGGGEEVRRTITMYRNGFVVDDGPYRRLDDPANAEFLRSLAQGVTPRELLQEEGQTQDVTVGLIDKRSEDYVEQFQSFSGAGATLGTTTTSSTTTTSTTTVDPNTLPETPPAVDANQPTTSIQIRLPDGKRKVLKLNLTMTVRDLAAHLRTEANGNPFQLLTGFPPKPIQDINQSIEEAGLKGASINMQSQS